MQTWWTFLKRRGMDFDRVIGVDESGRGPLAGPLVVAGVVLPRNHCIRKLNDCKLLTEKKRLELFEEIQKKAEMFVAISSNKEIDRKGIFVCTKHLMRRVIRESGAPIALIDAVSISLLDLVQFALTKGDQKVDCIAAASIVAKVVRDRMLVELDQKYPGYGLAEHKGYGTKQHREAILKLGSSRIHRKSFCESL